MNTTKLPRRLALLAAGLALLSLPLPASACVFYCWHAQPGVTCCQRLSCDIVCSGEPLGFAAGAQEIQSRAPLPQDGLAAIASPLAHLSDQTTPAQPATQGTDLAR
jgi:hypothetical protein